MNNTIVKSVANEFGMSVEQFLQLYRLQGYLGLQRLPGQLPSRKFLEDQDSKIDLGLDLDAMRKSSAWNRIERAARFGGETVKQFVTSSIMETVRCIEDDMVLSPRTGEPVCNSQELVVS